MRYLTIPSGAMKGKQEQQKCRRVSCESVALVADHRMSSLTRMPLEGKWRKEADNWVNVGDTDVTPVIVDDAYRKRYLFSLTLSWCIKNLRTTEKYSKRVIRRRKDYGMTVAKYNSNSSMRQKLSLLAETYPELTSFYSIGKQTHFLSK